MLIQLHWQNRDNLAQTEFVAQASTDDLPQDMGAIDWAIEIIKRRIHECPDGWASMLCREGSEYFVWAAATKHPGPAPLTPEEAQAAYDAAPTVPLSRERIEEIVRYATGKHPGPAPPAGV